MAKMKRRVSQAPNETFFNEPTQDDYKLLAQRWVAVRDLARGEYRVALAQSLATIDVLQRMLDEDLVSGEGVLAIGVVLGRIMATSIAGLDWWAVTDDFGRDLSLRFKATTLRVNPVSIVWKRFSRKDAINLRGLFDSTSAEISRLSSVAD